MPLAHAPLTIAVTGQYIIDTPAEHSAGTVTLITSGLTANCSIIPKYRPTGTGTTLLTAVPYTNLNTDASVAAGTPITVDGSYRLDFAGPEIILDATVTSGSASIYQWTVEGGSGSGSGGGGGGVGGAITSIDLGVKADAAVIDYTASASLIALTKGISEVLQGTGAGAVVPVKQQDGSGNVQPAGDVPGRALFVQAQGEIVDGSSATGVSSLIAGGIDSSGNARTFQNILLNSAPTSTSQYGLVTYSQVAAVGSANAVHAIGSGQNLGDGGNGSNYLAVVEGQFNGTSFDRRYGNVAITTLASAARTTTQTSADLINYNGRFLHVILNVTSAGTGSITLTINGKDGASSTYYPLLVGAAVTTNSQNIYRVGVGLTSAANSVANDFVPRTFQLIVTANNANTMTYSLGYNLLN